MSADSLVQTAGERASLTFWFFWLLVFSVDYYRNACDCKNEKVTSQTPQKGLKP